MLRRFIRSAIDRILWPVERRIVDNTINSLREQAKTSPETKATQRLLYHYYRNLVATGSLPSLQETGFRVFSQFEEDGKLLFVFAVMGISTGTFADIGAADGINSNCANLALNFGWRGVFVDGNPDNIRRGEAFYRQHPDTWAYPPRFIHAMVTRENINDILRTASLPEDIDLMSFDIDGNDYWVWDAIDCVTPKVVIIETHTEFGLRSIVVPYDRNYVYPGKHPDYHGASPMAMMKLANKKGYRLVGSNDYGFNTIYVRKGLAENVLPEVSVDIVLTHPRNLERATLFDPIKDWEYIEVKLPPLSATKR
jgi:hypothetical protein